MNRLEIRLLGPFEVLADGVEVTNFETDSTRALLAYLAAEAGHGKSRRLVAEMLWPDRPEGAALSNLRHALSVLRRAIGDRHSAKPILRADRNTVMVDPTGAVSVDLIEFEELVATPSGAFDAVERWRRAADVYRGDLLDGFTLSASAEWDEWYVATRERTRRHLADVLRRLADHLDQSGATDAAVPVARRLADVDPWEERNHRRLMRLLFRAGEGAQAVAHYEALRARLTTEFGLEPDPETMALVDRIRAGDIAAVSLGAVRRPAVLDTVASVQAPRFVERPESIARLLGHLDAAVSGSGRLVFVRGEAGTGKTMLADEFTNRAMDVPELLAAKGRCSAFGELGDPYLPFREVLGLLSGDVESAYAVGMIDRRHALRLWEAIPHSAQLLAEFGSDLIGSIVDGARLVERVEQATADVEWLDGFQQSMGRLRSRSATDRAQDALLDQYTELLRRLSISRPLLLVIDDLQWADRASLAMLWHLEQRVDTMRVLIVGLYRPGEIEGAPSSRPSFGDIVDQARVKTADAVIDVAGDRAFLDEFLDTEPNAFDADFRDRLFSYTGGHPLFTVEMVRGMRDRGEIRRDGSGAWVVSGEIDWDRLPSRVEAVIAQNLARIPKPILEDLTVASIQGEDFIAEVVGAVRADDSTPERLGLESASPSRLIEASGVGRVDGQLVARHRFRHALFQRYLYDGLDETRRVKLHEATGRALEDLYGESPDAPVHELALHFDRAGLANPAIGYLQQAGSRAMQMPAPEEAINLFRRALELLATRPETDERNERELDLLVSLTAPMMSTRGYAAPEMEQIGRRVRELCGVTQPAVKRAFALAGLASLHGVRGRYELAEATSREVLAIAEELDDTALLLVGNQMLGLFQTMMGDLAGGHASLERAVQLYDPDGHAWLRHEFGSAIGPEAMAWDSINMLHRGQLHPARERGLRAMERARETAHALSICHAVAIGGSVLRLIAGDYEAATPYIDEVGEIAEAEHIPFYRVAASIHRGVVIGMLEDPAAGIAAIDAGLDVWRQMGVESYRGQFLANVGDLEIRAGRPGRALEVVEQGIAESLTSGETLSVVMLRVMRGKALAAMGNDDLATSELEGVLLDVRPMGARLIELQAATELASIARRRGDIECARAVLGPVRDLIDGPCNGAFHVAARAVLAE